MSNMFFYNDNHDYEIGPAPAGPAESAHNTTLQLNCPSGLPGRRGSKLNHRTTNQPTARHSAAIKKTSNKLMPQGTGPLQNGLFCLFLEHQRAPIWNHITPSLFTSTTFIPTFYPFGSALTIALEMSIFARHSKIC